MRAFIGNHTGPRQFEFPPKAPVVDSAGLIVYAKFFTIYVNGISDYQRSIEIASECHRG